MKMQGMRGWGTRQMVSKSLAFIGNFAAEIVGRSRRADAARFSIRRLEGRRWCLRRARPMEIELLFGDVESRRGLPMSSDGARDGRVWVLPRSSSDSGKVLWRCWGTWKGTLLGRRAGSTSMQRDVDIAS